MKVRALRRFQDLKTGDMREAGEEFDVAKKRYDELADTPKYGALVEPVTEPEPEEVVEAEVEEAEVEPVTEPEGDAE